VAQRRRPTRVLIMGAAGRDFHNFNVVFRDDPRVEVVAFTAAQIPGIGGRRYPPELAGARYPEGIPVADEAHLEVLCREKAVDQVVFAYSDVSHPEVMHAASRALGNGPDFVLLGPARTMLRSRLPVIAVCAVRTGCGKSQTARWLSARLSAQGLRAAIVRHPMPYGDLAAQKVQRFATREALSDAHCTNEEREEYEPHIAGGHVVFAGVDYGAILQQAEAEADLVIWDGGNNDFPFIAPDLLIVLADALRPDQVATHHPGETVARMADVVVLAKVNAASTADVRRLLEAVRAINPRARVVQAASAVRLADPDAVAGRRVLVIEDGPTITHGGMAYGAGYVAAAGAGAREIVDPRCSASAAIASVYARYPHIGRVLPAVGYGDAQLAALGETINRSDAEVVVSATPCDLAGLIDIRKPLVRVSYELEEVGEPSLGGIIDEFVARRVRGGAGSG
jgi:predicted GTPase